MNFSSLKIGPTLCQPPHKILLKPTAFASDLRERRPRTDVFVGIKIVSEMDLMQGPAEARKKAWLYYPDEADIYSDDRLKIYNETLVNFVVARGICDPQNIDAPFMDIDEDNVEEYFSQSTIIALWDEILMTNEKCSPVNHEITQEERVALANILLSGGKIDPQTARVLTWCVRRFLNV